MIAALVVETVPERQNGHAAGFWWEDVGVGMKALTAAPGARLAVH